MEKIWFFSLLVLGFKVKSSIFVDLLIVHKKQITDDTAKYIKILRYTIYSEIKTAIVCYYINDVFFFLVLKVISMNNI